MEDLFEEGGKTYREDDKEEQEAQDRGDRHMLDEIRGIRKTKENALYAKLRKWYVYLNILLFLLGIAAAGGALYITVIEGTPVPKLMVWLSIVLLFVLPCIAHGVSIFLIRVYSPSFPLLGITNYEQSVLLKGPYLASLGFIVSGIVCLLIMKIPQLDSAIKAMPLGTLYVPVIFIFAVVVPFIIWLVMSILAFKARKDPFGP